jgi:hypothetical protein
MMKLTWITFCAALLLLQNTANLKLNDLDLLLGKKWTGTLTYLDYGTGKPEVIPTELVVSRSAKGPGVYNFATAYPKEPSHNGTDEVVISKDGTVLDGENVKLREVLADGTLKIVAQTEGTDNNKKATYRITYLLGKSFYKRKKEVCYVGETAYFTRNELSLN